jgi:hypothetical protein
MLTVSLHNRSGPQSPKVDVKPQRVYTRRIRNRETIYTIIVPCVHYEPAWEIGSDAGVGEEKECGWKGVEGEFDDNAVRTYTHTTSFNPN